MSDDGPEYETDFRECPEEYEIGRGEEGVSQPPFSRSGRRSRPLAAKIWTKKGALTTFGRAASLERRRTDRGKRWSR